MWLAGELGCDYVKNACFFCVPVHRHPSCICYHVLGVSVSCPFLLVFISIFLEAVTVTLYAYAVVLSHIIGCQG